MGIAWKFGENLNTDEIIPGRYNITIDPQELAKHVFCEIKPAYVEKMKSGDVIIGGQNFGCGSSREHAPLCIKAAGVSCVIARSFARIFFRNAINIGLPLLECPAAVEGSDDGDTLEVDLKAGKIRNIDKGSEFTAEPYPPFMAELMAAGGLIEYTKERLASRRI